MDGQKVWNNILAGIKTQVSSSTFKTWFPGSFVLDCKQKADKKLLIVAFKNNFIKEQVETRYLPLISQIAQKNKGGNIEVVFVVASKDKPKTIKNEPIFSGVPMQLNLKSKTAHILNPYHTFDNFVVGPSNNLAFLAAKQVAENPGSSYNPLIIYGPTGVGKTHLLQAIGNEVLNKTVEAKVLYATAEKFTNDYIESLGNKTCASFRAKYRQVDLLIVDDVQFFAGKESTQDEFFHTFNELYLSTRQVICASDRHPKELGKLKERLLSRFLGGLVADIGMPDLEMKIAIIRAKCQEKNLSLDDEISTYIAQTSNGGAREIEGNLISVLTLMKLTSGKITIEEIKEAIHKNGQASLNKPTASAIFSAVCKYFRVPAEDLRGPARRASLAFARQVLMYLLRKQLNLPFDEIGRLTGNRDHSTVIHGVAKIENIISQNQAKKDEVSRIQLLVNSPL
ncbi:chromosomal replication initiator protein DnaA [Candidatus Curtissbacteria bacterium RIFCSPLOWO2_02_41_11]|uniref:Chromosomal replication initiator protein DnaA n=3 Tax=Candidatus Curtissiibacteriota TaxID=1752717 RepID=A0A1F5HU04_9BACT|nr:MAG: Chromosomal replication initiator protein DnaA [Candidatus Curtissbacteria bacterium GW2011_GWA2_41_24]OGD88790.1 MAG: chromosomal replication initiator protein DnaA [Candidatus Curtissbacteria bacterium RIFCSPHIGHO2_02_39_8]OGE07445.1 MAG: chromosomal replication initiator protein DnaA [Candidatus Curtissbacteria bacterium RIFCSPLOWO2_02_41_11]